MAQSSFPTLISYLFIPSLWESVAGTATGSYLSYPVGQSNQTLTGTTKVSGLTIGGSNNITLGDGLVAPAVGQIGYTYSNIYTGASSTTGVTLLLPVTAGTYIITLQVLFTIVSPSTTSSIFLQLIGGVNDIAVTFPQTTPNTAGINFTTTGTVYVSASTTLYYSSALSTAPGTMTIYGGSTGGTFVRATRIA
jgi:hypothetical protein